MYEQEGVSEYFPKRKTSFSECAKAYSLLTQTSFVGARTALFDSGVSVN